jgi:signal transduction histidine kinase/CheY-like chemotaxis protein
MNKLETNATYSSLFRHIKAWFAIFVYKDGLRYINRLKLLQVTLFIVFFASSISNFATHLYYSLAITVSGAILIFGLGFFIRYNKLRTARLSFFFLIQLVVLSLNYVEGTSSGAYFHYFILIVIANFISVKEQPKDLILVYITTFIALIITFGYCPRESFLQNIEGPDQVFNLFLNAIISFFVGGFFSYSMMKDVFLKESVLVNKQNFLDSIYNTSLDAIFIVDEHTGIISDCNVQSLHLFAKTSKEEIVGLPLKDFLLIEDRESDSKLAAILEKNTFWQGELPCKSDDKKTFAGYISVVPLLNEGEVFKKINILDISDIKKARAEMQEAKEKAEQAVLVKTKFLSNMSHELRTPLNGIIGTTNLLLLEKSLDAQKKYFDVLKYSSEHMLKLINDILDFSKVEVGKMELEKDKFKLKAMLDNIHKLFEKQFEDKGIALEFIFDQNLDKTFVSDQTRLSQVISNLVSNALKFTEKGKAVVSLSRITQNSNACTIRFSVTDTGIGIPEDKQGLIFDRFTQVDSATTRKFGGTGLGLSISSKLVELFGGKLQVDSNPGQGSCFHFTIQLDMVHEQTSYVNEKMVEELCSLKGMNVLVAEDNVFNMFVAKAVLERWGIEITEAVNGKEALDKFNDKKYDVLLVDLDMPVMDGFELLDNIRKENKDIPIIAFTAAVFENMQAQLINKGFNDYISKPFRPEDLHEKIARFRNVA